MCSKDNAESPNISLEGRATFSFRAHHIDTNDCPNVEIQWVIERADGENEVYTVPKEIIEDGRRLRLPNIDFNGDCSPAGYCDSYIAISPTDLRYNGAIITGMFDHQECFSSPNVTDSTTLNIQGTALGIITLCINLWSVAKFNIVHDYKICCHV